MTAPTRDMRAAALGVLSRVATADPDRGIGPVLEACARELSEALAGCVAIYTAELSGRGFALAASSGRRQLPPRLDVARAPELVESLWSGEEAVAGEGRAGAELAAVGVAAGAILPARAGGRILGAVAVAVDPGRELCEAEREGLRAACQPIALALRAERLRERLRERSRLRAPAEGVFGEDEVRGRIVAEARLLTNARAAVLMLRDEDGRLAEVARDGEPALAPTPLVEAVAAGGAARREGEWLALPIPGAGPQPDAAGVLALAGTQAGVPDDDLDLLGVVAHQAAVALTNARLFTTLRRERDDRQSAAAALVLAQEQERRRVAEDLHDGAVQELVGLGLMLDALRGDVRERTPEIASEIDRAAAAARGAVRMLRRAIFDLHPMSLEELGFSAAISAIVQRLEWPGVKVSLDLEATEELSPIQRAAAFRICQEAIRNAFRHSGAERVDISARRRGGGVVLEISDDGRGFDPGGERGAIEAGHLGLATARQRAALAGGEMTVSTSEGEGTLVRLWLPLTGAPEDNS